MDAQGRALAATDDFCKLPYRQFAMVGRHCEGAGERQSKLGARAEADVLWRAAMNVDVKGLAHSQEVTEGSPEVKSTIGARSCGRPGGGGADSELNSGALDH